MAAGLILAALIAVGTALGADAASGRTNPDVCANIAGIQRTIPRGFKREVGRRCVRKPVIVPPIPAPVPAPPSVGARENPYPLGSSVGFSKNGAPLWTIKVVGVQPDAGAAVAAANRNNKVPAGFQDFMVTLEVAWTGQASGSFDETSVRAVGMAGIAYTTFGNSCGVIPQPTPGPSFLGSWPQQFTGSVVTGNVCWQIPAADAGSLVMFLSNSSAPAFFALH